MFNNKIHLSSYKEIKRVKSFFSEKPFTDFSRKVSRLRKYFNFNSNYILQGQFGQISIYPQSMPLGNFNVKFSTHNKKNTFFCSCFYFLSEMDFWTHLCHDIPRYCWICLASWNGILLYWTLPGCLYRPFNTYFGWKIRIF